MNRTAPTLVSLAVSLAVAIAGLGCAFGEIRKDDPFDRLYTLEGHHKHYSDLVRWSKFDDASSYILPEQRAGFVNSMPDFDEVRFTDWRAAPWKLDEEKRTASIVVTYKGYSLRSMYEIEFKETQTWKRTGQRNNWALESSFYAPADDGDSEESSAGVQDASDRDLAHN